MHVRVKQAYIFLREEEQCDGANRLKVAALARCACDRWPQQSRLAIRCKGLVRMAGTTRLELATSAVTAPKADVTD